MCYSWVSSKGIFWLSITVCPTKNWGRVGTGKGMCYQREWELEGREGKGLEGLPLCDLSTLRPWRGLLGGQGRLKVEQLMSLWPLQGMR